MSRVVISGYYGFNNTGDENILYAIIGELQKEVPGVEITVLSHDPQGTAARYGVKAVNRWNPATVLEALLPADLFISGGGSLLQDVSSRISPLYYLSVILLARLLRKEVLIYAQGIGPLRKGSTRRMTAFVFNRLRHITVRDEESRQELLSLGVGQEIAVAADPVLGLYGGDFEAVIGKRILERNGVQDGEGKKTIGVFIRSWRDNAFLPALAEAGDCLVKQGCRVVFVPLHYPHDMGIAQEAVKLMRQEAFCLQEGCFPWEVLSLMKNFDVAVGMRLHALINGAVAGIPVVGISYDPKVERFLGQIGQQALSADGLDAADLTAVVNEALVSGRETMEELQDRLTDLAEKAVLPAKAAAEILRKKEAKRHKGSE